MAHQVMLILYPLEKDFFQGYLWHPGYKLHEPAPTINKLQGKAKMSVSISGSIIQRENPHYLQMKTAAGPAKLKKDKVLPCLRRTASVRNFTDVLAL